MSINQYDEKGKRIRLKALKSTTDPNLIKIDEKALNSTFEKAAKSMRGRQTQFIIENLIPTQSEIETLLKSIKPNSDLKTGFELNTEEFSEFKTSFSKIIESKIEKLRSRLKTLDGKYDDFSEAIGDEITNQIKELTANKLKLENDLLTAVSAEYRAKQIIDFLKNMPEKITDAHQIDFRKVLVNVIVRSRDDLIFVIGNNDLTAIPLDATTSFNLKHKYTIRKTSFTTEFGIYINY